MIITKNHQKLLYYTMQYIVKVKYSSSMKCEYNDTKYRRILWIVLENVIKIKKKKKKNCDKKTLITEITTTKMLCFYSIQYIPKAKMLNMAKNKKLK